MFQRVIKPIHISPSKVIIRNAVNLAYKTYGATPPTSHSILTIHGLFGSKHDWDWQSERIAYARMCTVIAVDLRNHGDSPHTQSHTYRDLASDISELVKKLSLRKVSIIGQCIGGKAAMVYALNEPSKVKHLIIGDIAPISYGSVQINSYHRLGALLNSVDFRKIKTVQEGKLKVQETLNKLNVVPDIFTMESVLMNICERKGKIGWKFNLDTIVKNISEIASFPVYEMPKTFIGPTMFISGLESKFISTQDLPSIKRLFPFANLKYMPGVGHNIHAENRGLFLDLVKTFIQHHYYD